MTPTRAPIAPVWHTVLLLGVLAAFSVSSALLQMGTRPSRAEHLFIYSFSLVFEWLLLGFCLWKATPQFRQYLLQVTREPRRLLLDVPLGVALVLVVLLAAVSLHWLLGPAGWTSLEAYLPQGVLEKGLWLATALSAGISEETLFRGYLQQQFAAWTGHVSPGVFLQALAFGLAHGYQGWKHMLVIVVIGLILGTAAALRPTLRANMITHALLDSLAAF